MFYEFLSFFEYFVPSQFLQFVKIYKPILVILCVNKIYNFYRKKYNDILLIPKPKLLKYFNLNDCLKTKKIWQNMHQSPQKNVSINAKKIRSQFQFGKIIFQS